MTIYFTCRVRRVRDDAEYMLQDIGEVRLIETLTRLFVLLDIQQELIKNL